MQLQSKKADLIAFVIGVAEKCQLGVCRAQCHLGDSKVPGGARMAAHLHWKANIPRALWEMFTR